MNSERARPGRPLCAKASGELFEQCPERRRHGTRAYPPHASSRWHVVKLLVPRGPATPKHTVPTGLRVRLSGTGYARGGDGVIARQRHSRASAMARAVSWLTTPCSSMMRPSTPSTRSLDIDPVAHDTADEAIRGTRDGRDRRGNHATRAGFRTAQGDAELSGAVEHEPSETAVFVVDALSSGALAKAEHLT